jgi:hypothetical protein
MNRFRLNALQTFPREALTAVSSLASLETSGEWELTLIPLAQCFWEA